MKTLLSAMAVSALALGQAFASDPKQTQDPPGAVGVDQPAGISVQDRNTERDETDTLRGGGRTDVIDGERAGRRAGPSISASEARGEVRPGSEARASFDGSTAGARPVRPADDVDVSPSDSSESTYLGTDLGYGTGTDAPATSPAR